MHLDHIVINVGHGMDRAMACFEALGFTLTPRGHHHLGSINHLMVFEDRYLELIGLPAEGPVRKEIADSPLGLDGLVLRSDDAQASARALAEAGFEPHGPQRLTRPVRLDDGEHEAAFMTVRLPGQFAAGRVYYCQHLTPELLWRPEWMRHANGVSTLTGLAVSSADPGREAARYGRLPPGSPPPGSAPFTLHWQSAAERPGLPGMPPGPGREERFQSVSLACQDLALIARLAGAAGLPSARQGERLVVGLPDTDTLLEFHR